MAPLTLDLTRLPDLVRRLETTPIALTRSTSGSPIELPAGVPAALARIHTALRVLAAVESAGRADLIASPTLLQTALERGALAMDLVKIRADLAPLRASLSVARDGGRRAGVREALDAAYAAGSRAAREQAPSDIRVELIVPKDAIKVDARAIMGDVHVTVPTDAIKVESHVDVDSHVEVEAKLAPRPPRTATIKGPDGSETKITIK